MSIRFVRSNTRSVLLVTSAVFALAAGACSSDDPAVSAGGVDICAVETPDVAPEAAAGAGFGASIAFVAFADEGHDHDDEAPPEESPAEETEENPAGSEVHDDSDGHHDDDEGSEVHDDSDGHHDEDEGHDEEGHDEADALAGVDLVADIEMDEFSYRCVLEGIEVGTTVALRFHNVGVVAHEAVIGDLDAQLEAAAEMAELGSDHVHDHDSHEAPSVTVEPGETGILVVSFDEPAELIVGCHIPGHWDAGMRSDFRVS